MKTWLRAIAMSLALCGAYCASAYAQAPTARVVTTCPGGQVFAIPGPGALTVDINGTLCSSGSGGGGGSLGTAVGAVGTGTTGAVTATIAGTISVTNYLCSVDLSGAGTGLVAPVTITGLQEGTLTWQSISAGNSPFVRNFSPCKPASAVNTAITITTTADASATAVNVDITGYQR